MHVTLLLYVVYPQTFKLPVIPVGDTVTIQHYGATTCQCATSFRAHPAAAGRVSAMVAGCSLSTRGFWDGPGICDAWKQFLARDAEWKKAAFEHVSSTCLGQVTLCPVCRVRNLLVLTAV